MRRVLLAALAGTIVVSGVGSRWSVTAQEPDPFIGKWTVNIAKSKFEPDPPPKSWNRSIDDRGNDVMVVTNESVNAQGNQLYQQMAFKPDGLEYPIATKGAPVILTIALKRLDRLNVEYTLKAEGKVIQSVRGVMSKDGKTYTETVKGTRPHKASPSPTQCCGRSSRDKASSLMFGAPVVFRARPTLRILRVPFILSTRVIRSLRGEQLRWSTIVAGDTELLVAEMRIQRGDSLPAASAAIAFERV